MTIEDKLLILKNRITLLESRTHKDNKRILNKLYRQLRAFENN